MIINLYYFNTSKRLTFIIFWSFNIGYNSSIFIIGKNINQYGTIFISCGCIIIYHCCCVFCEGCTCTGCVACCVCYRCADSNCTVLYAESACSRIHLHCCWNTACHGDIVDCSSVISCRVPVSISVFFECNCFTTDTDFYFLCIAVDTGKIECNIACFVRIDYIVARCRLYSQVVVRIRCCVFCEGCTCTGCVACCVCYRCADSNCTVLYAESACSRIHLHCCWNTACHGDIVDCSSVISCRVPVSISVFFECNCFTTDTDFYFLCIAVDTGKIECNIACFVRIDYIVARCRLYSQVVVRIRCCVRIITAC